MPSYGIAHLAIRPENGDDVKREENEAEASAINVSFIVIVI